jgi:hypothetical protein
MVAGRAVFAGFGPPTDEKKRGGAKAYAARRAEMHFGTQIPASIETLTRHARAPRGLPAARHAAKSEAA